MDHLTKTNLAQQEDRNHMKILKFIDAYRELHLNATKCARSQINPQIASRLGYFLVSKIF